MQDVTLEMVYREIKMVNKKVSTLEHLLIPEEQLSEAERKEIHELIKDAEAGNETPFSQIKK